MTCLQEARRDHSLNAAVRAADWGRRAGVGPGRRAAGGCECGKQNLVGEQAPAREEGGRDMHRGKEQSRWNQEQKWAVELTSPVKQRTFLTMETPEGTKDKYFPCAVLRRRSHCSCSEEVA